MKIKCKVCGRMVGIIKGTVVKHRVGRSTPTKEQMACEGSEFSRKFKKVEVPNNRKARRAAMFAAKKEALEKAINKKVEVPNNRKARRAAMFAAKKEALEKAINKKVKA